ncbi:hypothetical protein BGZ90_004269, partial [Linnemannia elongata]
RWLPEVYAERYGGATEGFVDGLRIMSAWRHFPLKTFTHVLLKYCESDRGKKQLALLNSFSGFQVVSDHLAINAGLCSAEQIKDTLYPSTDVKNDNGSYGSRKADIDFDGRETPPQKKARNKLVKEYDSSPVPLRVRSSQSSSYAPLFAEGSAPSSPEQSTLLPPSPPNFIKIVGQEADAFFNSAGSLQDILLSNLRDGHTLPPWAKDRPSYTFKLRLRDDWGPRVTDLYKAAKAKAVLDHTHIDEIALLSGILHLNKSHIGFTEQENKAISREVLETFYNQDRKEEDIQRAQDATFLWSSWVQKWKVLLQNEKVAAQRENRDPVEVVDTEPVVDAILASYADCKSKKITSIFFIALHVFRQYNNWAALVSELDCLMAVVGPILNEIMALQQKIKFTCANACTSVGKSRKVQLQQDGQSRQPDVIGQTKNKKEVFYGELKGPRPKTEAVNTDILRLAIFSKDSLDQLHNTLVHGPPLLTFQAVGRDVTFFLATKIDNTIVHVHLSTINLPSSLTEVDLDYDFFFHLFQVQTLIKIASERLENKREEPLQEMFFPTLGTPERNAALKSPVASKRA